MAAAGAPLLHLQSVTRTYGTAQNPVPVLRGVDLQIEPGEYVAVAGPSGSGKSTVLNILGCLDRPSSGSYWLAGEDVSVLDDRSLSRIRNRRIGFVFQSFQLVAHLSVVENIEPPLCDFRRQVRQQPVFQISCDHSRAFACKLNDGRSPHPLRRGSDEHRFSLQAARHFSSVLLDTNGVACEARPPQSRFKLV